MHNYLNLANRLRCSVHVASPRALSLALQTARAFRGRAAPALRAVRSTTGGGGNCGYHKAVTARRGRRGVGGGGDAKAEEGGRVEATGRDTKPASRSTHHPRNFQ